MVISVFAGVLQHFMYVTAWFRFPPCTVRVCDDGQVAVYIRTKYDTRVCQPVSW